MALQLRFILLENLSTTVLYIPRVNQYLHQEQIVKMSHNIYMNTMKEHVMMHMNKEHNIYEVQMHIALPVQLGTSAHGINSTHGIKVHMAHIYLYD